MMADKGTMAERTALLAIDTSSSVCSLALLTADEVVAERTDREQNAHARQIGVFARELLDIAQEQGLRMEGITLSSGPGSYTGLRIGASFAKGYAFATGKPIIAISTLEALAAGFLQTNNSPEGARIVPMLDAGRMEVYTASYSSSLEELSAPQSMIVTPESFQEEALSALPLYFVGSGAAKCQSVITHADASFISLDCMARNMQKVAFQRYASRQFVDLAYWEPDYIKSYNAVIAKNKVLNR